MIFLVTNCPVIIGFVKNNHGMMYFAWNGPGMIDFLKDIAGVLVLVVYGLVMIGF